MVKIKKDSRKWFFKGKDKKSKEELPVEWINGIMSYIETGTLESSINLPYDYENSQFPDDNGEHEVKFASNVSISGDFENNQQNIKLNQDGNIRIGIYPNIAPFKYFNNVTIESDTIGAELRLIFRDFAGNIVYNQTKNVESTNVLFDLTPLEIGLETVSAELMTNTNETIINNIIFSFDLTPHKVDKIFKSLVKLNPDGKINATQIDIKYISGAEDIFGEELPVNPANNNIILPENLYPNIIIDENGDVWITWYPSDVSAQINQMKQQIETLKAIVENNTIPYAVGDIISTTNQNNPSSRPGWGHTTWEAYAKGRVLVGIDPNDSDFSSVGKMGGAKKHKLTVNEMPTHNHSGSIGSGGSGNTGSNSHSHGLKYRIYKGPSTGIDRVFASSSGDNTSGSSITTTNTHNHSIPNHTHGLSIGSSGGNGEHNNLQPYVSVYIWRRVA